MPNAGIDEVREAAARYIQGRTGVSTQKENVLVTQGAVLSVATAFLAVLDAGDEVLLPDPGWPNYSMAVTLVRGRAVFYSLCPERKFLPDLDELETLVTDRTKLILLCSPSNPTGQVHGRELTERLVEFARRHDLYVLADEIYAEIVFDGVDHASAASFDEHRPVVNGSAAATWVYRRKVKRERERVSTSVSSSSTRMARWFASSKSRKRIRSNRRSSAGLPRSSAHI